MFKTFTGAIIRHPYLLLLLAVLLTFVLLLFVGHKQVDIHLHDTIFVVSATFLLWVQVLIFGVIGLLYFWFDRFLQKRTLTWLHVGLTLGAVLGMILVTYWYPDLFLDNTHRYVMDDQIIRPDKQSMLIYTVLTLSFVIAQLIFIGHLIYGLIRYFLKKRTL